MRRLSLWWCCDEHMGTAHPAAALGSSAKSRRWMLCTPVQNVAAWLMHIDAHVLQESQAFSSHCSSGHLRRTQVHSSHLPRCC